MIRIHISTPIRIRNTACHVTRSMTPVVAGVATSNIVLHPVLWSRNFPGAAPFYHQCCGAEVNNFLERLHFTTSVVEPVFPWSGSILPPVSRSRYFPGAAPFHHQCCRAEVNNFLERLHFTTRVVEPAYSWSGSIYPPVLRSRR